MVKICGNKVRLIALFMLSFVALAVGTDDHVWIARQQLLYGHKVHFNISRARNDSKLYISIVVDDTLLHDQEDSVLPYLAACINNYLMIHSARNVYVFLKSNSIAGELKKMFEQKYAGAIAFLQEYYDGKFNIQFIKSTYQGVEPVCYFSAKPEIDAQKGIIIGIDRGGSSIKGVVLNNGVVVSQGVLVSNIKQLQTYNEHEAILLSFIQKLLQDAKIECANAIGISWCAPVDSGRIANYGKCFNLSYDDYRQLQLLPINLQARLNMPVYVIHDGHAAAWFEAISNKRTNALCLGLGTSLAAGFIDTNGHINSDLAELSRFVVDLSDNALPDTRGTKGAVQPLLALKSNTGFMLGINAQSVPDHEDLKKLLSDKVRADMLATYLAESVAVFYQYYHTENVLLYGGVAACCPDIVSNIQRYLKTKYPQIAWKLEIDLATQPYYCAALGAAYFASNCWQKQRAVRFKNQLANIDETFNKEVAAKNPTADAIIIIAGHEREKEAYEQLITSQKRSL